MIDRAKLKIKEALLHVCLPGEGFRQNAKESARYALRKAGVEKWMIKMVMAIYDALEAVVRMWDRQRQWMLRAEPKKKSTTEDTVGT